MRIGVVLGTRPEIIKNYSVVKALRASGANVYVVYTNQHCLHQMGKVFFDDLGYSPDFVLEGTYSIGRAIDWVRHIISNNHLDLIIVNGDTAAALVGAIAGIYSGVKVAHIEAGLRAFDEEMLEERNRIMVDCCSHFLFTYTDYEAEYLRRHPEIRGKIFNIGNTTVDLIEDFYEKIVTPPYMNYAYVTLHRKEFTDSRNLMVEVFKTIAHLCGKFDQVFFPVHPRTRDAMRRHKISPATLGHVTLLDPIPVFKSLSYQKSARLILTDSGTVQEEAYLFGVPCVTIRNNSERHLTVLNGANVVSGFKKMDILAAVEKQLNLKKKTFPDIYGAYGVGQRIADILLERRPRIR